MANKEITYKEIIRKNLNNVLTSGYIPELGNHKSGKVRDVHFTNEKVGSPIIMVASDRVSAFDHILNEAIPYKGKVLNLFAKWAFKNTEDIIPNALEESPHDNVVIQKYYKNLGFEFVVRGYVWGSMAASYEKGEQEICGIKLPEGLLRYQKLDEPLFTPTTKAEEHDENVTYEKLTKALGKDLARNVKNKALELFKRASDLAEKQGFIFIDTKYEFGTDGKGNIYLIDEANTPDSSRYCSKEEYKKFENIKKEMTTGKYQNVSELLKKKPKLKIEEQSKQFVRDVLTESGFSYGAEGKIPSLTEDQVIETSYRYISLYEDVTGQKFDFGNEGDVSQGLVSGLKNVGYIKGGLAVIMAGSDSDKDHMKTIKDELDKYGIPSVARICSAHKQAGECVEIIQKYNKSLEPILIIAVAGGTDALSGVASFHSVWPVISCPPKKEEFSSCITNPPGSPNALILRPGNVAKFATQYLGYSNKEFHRKISAENAKKINSLVEADLKAQKGELF
ncbi:MAG: AIR carboxylase family protein [Patescibacteria group bacterium]|nr:AIR carboxylase family protein [Patescibacteria group bacterium]MCL5094196.1 AIR carboxylase family protein [Patescibacteria group bacterium]